MNVDLHQLATQKEASSASQPGQPGQRTLRRKNSKAGKRQGSK